jgi:hypothetical protein
MLDDIENVCVSIGQKSTEQMLLAQSVISRHVMLLIDTTSMSATIRPFTRVQPTHAVL